MEPTDPTTALPKEKSVAHSKAALKQVRTSRSISGGLDGSHRSSRSRSSIVSKGSKKAAEKPQHNILKKDSSTRTNQRRKDRKKSSKKSSRKDLNKSMSSIASLDSESHTIKKRSSQSLYQLLNSKEPSPTSVRQTLTQQHQPSDGASCASAYSRLSAKSAVNRCEMRTVIKSIQQHKNGLDGRKQSYKQLEEASQQFEEERQAILLKWQAMSANRKSSLRRGDDAKDSNEEQSLDANNTLHERGDKAPAINREKRVENQTSGV